MIVRNESTYFKLIKRIFILKTSLFDQNKLFQKAMQ